MGKKTGDYLTLQVFPNSYKHPLRITSPEDSQYNCLAWAHQDTQKWWDSDEDYYWMEGIPRNQKLTTFIQLFERLGFTIANNIGSEQERIRVALYTTDNIHCAHVARQLSNGLWTSKLGVSYDVEHTLEALEGELYGRVYCVMRK